MNSSHHLFARLIASFLALMAVIGMARPAQAMAPKGGYLWTTSPEGLFVEVGPDTADITIIRAFNAQYEKSTGEKLTPQVIQAANPKVTWSACAKPPPGGRATSKGDASAWRNCAKKTSTSF
jgi:hypothetical protein